MPAGVGVQPALADHQGDGGPALQPGGAQHIDSVHSPALIEPVVDSVVWAAVPAAAAPS